MAVAKKADLAKREVSDKKADMDQKDMSGDESGSESPDEDAPEGVVKFGTYDLIRIGVPPSARPRAGQVYNGKHGYTLRSENGAVSWPI